MGAELGRQMVWNWASKLHALGARPALVINCVHAVITSQKLTTVRYV